MNIIAKRLIAVAAAIPLAVGLGACSSSTTSSSSNPVVKIGVTDASKSYWNTLVDEAAQEGITVEIVGFTDYQQPNPALSDGSLDLNQFQHLVFLANYNVNAGDDLVPIGATFVYPLGLYSQKYTDPADIPDGSEIAIPNDSTNQARALLVLQSAGLLTLKDGGNAFSTPDDIIADESHVTVTPVSANQTAASLPDVAGAVINQNYLTDAGLEATDAIYSDADSNMTDPYINVFAAKAADKDNPTYQKIVELYQSTSVIDEALEASGGTAVKVTDKSADELQSILTGLEDEIKG